MGEPNPISGCDVLINRAILECGGQDGLVAVLLLLLLI